jgi:hypothetical protein
LSTKAFKWLHTEAWNDDKNAHFVAFRQAPPLGAFAGVPYESGRRRTPPTLVGRWLLEDEGGAPLAAVEAQGYWRGFRSLHVLISDCAAPGGWQGEWLEALSFMVSGLFILTEADVVRLLPTGSAGAEQLLASDFGVAMPVWTPFRAAAPIGGQWLTTVVCDSSGWWQRPIAQRDRAALTYIEKRRDMADRMEQLENSRPRRGGILTRLTRLFSRRS